MRKREEHLVANVGFPSNSYGGQISPDGRYLYTGRHEPPRQEIMIVDGWP